MEYWSTTEIGQGDCLFLLHSNQKFPDEETFIPIQTLKEGSQCLLFDSGRKLPITVSDIQNAPTKDSARKEE